MNLSNKWFPFTQFNKRAAIRLFCFPYSGAGASIFLDWFKQMPDFIEVVPVQLPGREERFGERPFTQTSPLIQKLATEMLPHLYQPFALFGHSMGALISFELARYLQQTANITPAHLFVSGHAAPQEPSDNDAIHLLPNAKFLARLRELNGTPAEVLHNKELCELLLPIIRADFTLCETHHYQPAPPLHCPITALGGLTDPYINRSNLDAWRTQTTAHFILRMFPGDHFYLNNQHSLLLRILAQELCRQKERTNVVTKSTLVRCI